MLEKKVCVWERERGSEKETIKGGRKWGGDTKGRTGVERKGEERHSREVQERRGLAARGTAETDKHTLLLPPASSMLTGVSNKRGGSPGGSGRAGGREVPSCRGQAGGRGEAAGCF